MKRKERKENYFPGKNRFLGFFFWGGGKETRDKIVLFTTVADRTREALLTIIKTNILPKTTKIIISDCWKA